MKKQIVLIVVWLSIVTAGAYAYDDGDFQIWNTDVQEFKLNNDSKIVLEEEFRLGDNSKEFYYHHYDAGFSCNLKKYLNIGGGYRHIYELKKEKFKQESEPYITATLFWDIKGFKFEDRNRIEYRYFDYQADSSRYRNKVTVKLPFKFTSADIRPYLSDEIFISFGGIRQFNQNRLSSGVGVTLTNNVKAEIYYMLQGAKSSGKWVDTNILGLKLRASF